jgi:hypothetical protein
MKIQRAVKHRVHPAASRVPRLLADTLIALTGILVKGATVEGFLLGWMFAPATTDRARRSRPRDPAPQQVLTQLAPGGWGLRVQLLRRETCQHASASSSSD